MIVITLLMILSHHLWYVLTRAGAGDDKHLRPYQWSIFFALPVVTVILHLILTANVNKWFKGVDWSSAISDASYQLVQVANTYSFTSPKPLYIHLIAYEVPFALCAVISMLLSIWVSVKLLVLTFKQRRTHQQLIDASSDAHATDIRRMFKQIPPALIYRTTLLAVLCGLTIATTYIPSLGASVGIGKLSATPNQPASMSVREFCTSLLGIGMFAIFGTGQQSTKFLRYHYHRIMPAP